MDKIVLGLDFGKQVFKIEKSRYGVTSYFEIKEGGYCGQIQFRSKNYAFVKYKNLFFHGQVLSDKNWEIYIRNSNFSSDIVKRGNVFLYNGKKHINPYYKPKNTFNYISDNLQVYNKKNQIDEEKAHDILERCEKKHYNLYIKIKKIKEFEKNLFNIIISDFENSDSENDFIEDSKSCFESCLFIEALSVGKVYELFPELSKHNIDENKLRVFINNMYTYSDIDTYVDILKEDLYEEIINKFNIEYQKKDNSNIVKLEYLIYEIWEEKAKKLKQKDKFLSRINYLLQIGQILNEDDIRIKGKELYSLCKAFENEYDKYLSIWGCEKIVVMDEEKSSRFKECNNIADLTDEERCEYELVYKDVMQYYNQCLYNKKNKKLKQIVQKFPDFIKRAKQIIELLIKYTLFVETEETFTLGTSNNIEIFLKELYKVEDSI